MPRPVVPMPCQQCGRTFPGYIRKDKPRKFCSLTCRDEARRTGVLLVCRQCDQGFYRKRYQESWSQERGPFCSMPCYGEWQREHTGGPSNPNFRPHGSVRAAGQWERNRLIALERDGYRCWDCGSTKPRVVVHHVKPWQPGQVDPHAVDNLRTLCDRCHRRTHADLRRSAQS